MNRTLAIEIGTEELPPKALLKLSKAFAANFRRSLEDAGFSFESLEDYATPRRLALKVTALEAQQPERQEQRRGPAVKAAFDDAGEPTKAALGFARSCGVEVSDLTRIATDKGEWLAWEATIPGQSVTALIGDFTQRALAQLPIPKRMRWGASEVEFVRPVHWLLALYGEDVVECEVLGLRSDRMTRGHRFHHGGTITLDSADAYPAILEHDGHVLADFAARRDLILKQVERYCAERGETAVIDPDLLDEVTALVEWPTVIGGSFEARFLELPEEALIASMQGHQKYFPVRTAEGALGNHFITISNIESRDPGQVRDGNERVIRPRLSDADFFYRTDRHKPLAERSDALADMLFEKRLGSLADKTGRVQGLAQALATACGAEQAVVERAALLSRCDLLTEMVGEFPELQGTMGRYYAEADGEDSDVSAALGAFYQPRFAGDAIPSSAAGRCIALADKLDTLVGIFGIGQAPTGDKDPYALRRAALGCLRILIEGDIDLDLGETLAAACDNYGGIELAGDTDEQVYAFMRERLRGYYIERGTAPDVCAAVLANAPRSPREIARRIEAVTGFRELEAAGALAAANKRIANILRKLETPQPDQWRRELFEAQAETDLADALEAVVSETTPLFDERAYDRYLARLAALRQPVDRFFDDVMVMTEDAALRDNRLALLGELHALFSRVADISHLHEA